MDLGKVLKLYLITERSYLRGRDLKKSVEDSILGGVTVIQVREKNISSRLFYEVAMDVKQVTDYYKLPLIINDRIDIAQAVNAAGVHLGQSDIHMLTARKILGPEKIIGISAGNVQEAIEAEKNGADYLGIGPVYPTGSKSDANEPIGVEGLKKVVEGLSIPSVAIGGINQDNFREVMKAGVNGISIISAILDRADIKKAAENLTI
ncbi:MAG: thiamine phosphate synthase [Clostridiaceae bacterium]